MKLAMVAGEPSGDLLGGLLLQGLQNHWPELQTIGIGGPHMREQGLEPWWSSSHLAVRGYAEVLRHYSKIIGIRRKLNQRLLQWRPDVFIGIDAPDFNLPLEEKLKLQGIKTVQFICPSIWAWRAERVHRLRRSVNHVLCLFPFEPELLAQHDIAATYVGHPLAQVIPMQTDKLTARQQLGLKPTEPVVALLPGSRRSEVIYLADRFFQAARLIRQVNPATQFVVPVVAGLQTLVQQAIERANMTDAIRMLNGQSHCALEACDVTLIASGTATLEAALFKRPMVIAYNMHPLSWLITQRKRLQPWVGLPNILCADQVVPELLQNQATPEALAQATLQWMQCSSQTFNNLEKRFTVLHQQLQRNTVKLACHAIASIL